MKENNCMFQFYTKDQMFHDTGLITLKEALFLFETSKEMFVKELKDGNDPQMAVWIDCKHNSDYSEALHYWDCCDVKVDDTGLWVRA